MVPGTNPEHPEGSNPMSAPEDEQYDGPVFGEGPVETRPFHVVVHGPGDPPEGRRERFKSYVEVDAGLIVAMLRATSDDESTRAGARLILNAAVDSDGLSSLYVPPLIDDEDDARVKAGEASLGDVDELHEDFKPDWEDPETWSSQRRLTRIFDDPDQYVKQSVIVDLAQWMAQESGARPTGPARPSSTGPRRTGRGSGARRSSPGST